MQNVPSAVHVQQKLPQVKNVEFQEEGGFKAVYKGDVAGKIEAIKAIYIPPESDDDSNRDELIGRIRREVESLAKCQSGFIVRLGSLTPDIYEINDHDYLIYSEEYLEGESLRTRIKQRYRPDFRDGKQLTTCLFSAIQVLKDNGLIHRDIKPDNIMALGDSARPFVMLDLGIAYKPQGTPLTANSNMRHGTLPYMAPEIFTPHFRDTLDFRSDLYSAGVTIYEYMAGKHPIARRGEDDYTTMYRITHIAPEPIVNHRPDLPDYFCRLIDQLVKKLPALRPSNIGVMLKRLEEET